MRPGTGLNIHSFQATRAIVVPELPDVVVYIERLRDLAMGSRLRRVRAANPFVLRTVEPPLAHFDGRPLSSVERIGKRIVLGFPGDLYLLIHLMIAGRLRWRGADAAIPKAGGLAAFDFDAGTLLFTEAGKKRRASLHAVEGRDALRAFDRGGLEVMDSDLPAFRAALEKDNHTLKRALTDQSVLSGIGNAYSDEILLRAQLSPFKQTRSLSNEEMARLFDATREILGTWTEKLRQAVGDGFPEKVTAFREGMAVHGRYREPCPVCESPVQRIVYAESESNYCARCQTGGRVLADRSLSRLLKKNRPRRIEELEG
jgi:formamidopyrimidine-DNA glycosylase